MIDDNACATNGVGWTCPRHGTPINTAGQCAQCVNELAMGHETSAGAVAVGALSELATLRAQLAGEREAREKAERERDEAIEALENEQAKGIHTCHDNCQRPMCVMRRERNNALTHYHAERVRADKLWDELARARAEGDELCRAAKSYIEAIYVQASMLEDDDTDEDATAIDDSVRDAYQGLQQAMHYWKKRGALGEG